MSLKYEITQAALGAKQWTNDTVRVIRSGCKHFSNYCSSEGLNKLTKIQEAGPTEVIQGFTDYLVSQNYSPSSIHSYIYGPCLALGIHMQCIRKPRRVSSSIKRSRDKTANPLGRIEEGKSEFARLVGFQKRVGIRRSELAHLRGNCITYDEANKLCVVVASGKGGKRHLQRILPQDEEYIKNFFKEIDPDKYVFSSTELRNSIDLHKLRAIHARDAYEYYVSLSPEDREKLLHDICKRWLVCHPTLEESSKEFRKWYSDLFRGGGTYKLRGANYDRAVKAGRPTEYDRLCLAAVSLFHLSHFRLQVTVTNYML